MNDVPDVDRWASALELARAFADGGPVGLAAEGAPPEFAAWWVEHARPGDRIRYFVGSSLGLAARRSRRVRDTARLLLGNSAATVRRMGSDRHVRGVVRGSGRVALFQRRIGPREWGYVAVKLADRGR